LFKLVEFYVVCLFTSPTSSRQLSIGIRVKLSINKLNRLKRRCLESKKLKGEIPFTNEGGTGKSPPLSGGDGLKPTSPSRSKADQLNAGLKVLDLQEKIAKLKKKLRSKKIKVQEVSSSSSNEEVNDSSSSDERTQAKKGNGRKKKGSNPSYNTTPFNYDSLPSTIPSPPCTSERCPVLMG
jgi:hypothetical protein